MPTARVWTKTWWWAGVSAAVFVALWLYTERRWTDVTVDFGRELYVAWRLAEGEVLHTDLAWFAGPLSAEVNGTLFRVFGVSLTTLVVANTAIAVALFAALFALVRRHTSATTAGVVTCVALMVFGFGQHGGIGNYDYVTPYSHEPVHGLVLGIGAVAATWHAAERARRSVALLAGALLALVFLTKAEPFVAAAAGVLAALVLGRGPRRATTALSVSLGLTLTLGLVYGSYARSLGAEGGARAVLGTWWHVAGGEVTSAHFYERLAGLDDPRRSLVTLARWSGAWLVALCAVVAVARLVPRRVRDHVAVAAVLGAVAFVVVRGALDREDVYDVGGPILVASALVTLGGLARVAVVRRPLAPPADGDRAHERVVWAVFASASLLKLGLRPTFVFYGFVHALPAFVLVAATVLHGLPRAAARWLGAPPRPVAAGVVGLLLALGALHLSSNAFWRRFKVHEVGAGGDRILADGRGDEVRDTIAWLGANTAPEERVLVLPEGLSINYWARRRAPTRHLGFMPTELALFGESDIVAALAASPPSTVVLVHKDTTDYGARFFGTHYGRALATWLAERYEPVIRFGDPPFVDLGFGIVVMRQRAQ